MKKIFLSIFALVLCATISAQNPLWEQEINEAVEQQVRHVVNAFTMHLGCLMDKSKSDSIKDYHIESALDLFIGHGDAIVEDGQEEIPAPRIQISFVSKERVETFLVKTYLHRLKKLRYADVILGEVTFYVYEIQPIDNENYETILTIGHLLSGKQEGQIIYDEPPKRFKVHASNKYNVGTTHWQILLGDVSIQMTER